MTNLDLTGWLRQRANIIEQDPIVCEKLDKAADEIERLERAWKNSHDQAMENGTHALTMRRVLEGLGSRADLSREVREKIQAALDSEKARLPDEPIAPHAERIVKLQREIQEHLSEDELTDFVIAWKCDSCETVNDITSKRCQECDTRRIYLPAENRGDSQ